MEAIFLFGLFLILLMLSVPIGYAIGIVTLVTMLEFTSMPTLMIAQNSIAGGGFLPAFGHSLLHAGWEPDERWRDCQASGEFL